jgi:hypothetical protein
MWMPLWSGTQSMLGRDDQLGCPVFSPIDHAETRLALRTVARSRRTASATSSVDSG